MNRKGFGNQVLFVIVLGVIMAVIIAGYFIFSISAPLIQELGGQFTTSTQLVANKAQPIGNANVSDNAQVALGIVDSALAPLEWIGYLTLSMLFLGFIIALAMVRGHPGLIFVWAAVIVGLGIMSIFVSNSYEEAYYQSALNSALDAWSTNHFIMTHLPHIIITFGIVSVIVMLILISTDREEEAIGI